MIDYDILMPDSDYNKALETLSDVLSDIYTESWVKDKQATYGKPFNMNLATFAQLWFNSALKIFIASDNGKTVGFMVGMVFRPLPYDASVFQIEDWYSADPTVVKGLFDYAVQAIRFIGCDEIWIADRADREPVINSAIWKEHNRFLFRRYTRS